MSLALFGPLKVRENLRIQANDMVDDAVCLPVELYLLLFGYLYKSVSMAKVLRVHNNRSNRSGLAGMGETGIQSLLSQVVLFSSFLRLLGVGCRDERLPGRQL